MIVNRDEFLRHLVLAKPALAPQAYIEIMTYFCVEPNFITTYNESAGMEVAYRSGLSYCIPGDILLRALGTLPAKAEVDFRETDATGLSLVCGRSKLKVPYLLPADFPLDIDRALGKSYGYVDINDDVLVGLDRCLQAVGSNPQFPAQMGITLDVNDAGHLTLYSTDESTISRYQTKTPIKLPANAPVLLPTFFCEQMVSLAKAFPEDSLRVSLHSGAVQLQVGKSVRIFNKLLHDLTPLDFPAVLSKHVLDGKAADLPLGWEAALSRSLLVLGAEADKAMQITVESKRLLLDSKSQVGEANDDLEWTGAALRDPVMVDPTLLQRGSKSTTRIGFSKAAVALISADGKFTHIIAYCAK